MRSVCLPLLVCAAGLAVAHPSIDLQLKHLDDRILADPDNGELYLKRGEMHRVHQDWAAAEKDYRRARKLDRGLPVDFALGRMKLEAGDAAAARKLLDRFLAHHPGHADALVARARSRVQLGQPLSAAEDFSRALAALEEGGRPIPAYYLERARALAAAGEQHRTAALAGLDQGLARLSNPVTLQLYAIELEIDMGRYDAGLARLDQIMTQSARKESWLIRRAEILEQAGRSAEARKAYTAALRAIETLPASRRWNRAVGRLQEQAETAVERLETKEGSAPARRSGAAPP